MNIHELKTLPPFYEAVLNDSKPFEVRNNDRNFQVGDLLILHEWDGEKFTDGGRNFTCRVVTYILPGGQFGIADDFVVMGLRRFHVGEGRYVNHPDNWKWGLGQ